MTAEEMDNMFDVLYNNITSTQAPGLNAYEKSIFLTKAQDELVKNYFNPKSKGNNTQEGFDDNPKRQIDFSMLTSVYSVPRIITIDGSGEKVEVDETTKDSTTETGSGEKQEIATASETIDETSKDTIPDISGSGEKQEIEGSGSTSGNTTITPTPITIGFGESLFDTRKNTKSVVLPTDVMLVINEVAEVTRNGSTVILQIIPIKFTEYSRLMLKPYKRPIKYQAWRLINTDSSRKVDIVVGPSDTITKYTLRYIRKPKPIIVSNLDGLTIDGKGDTCNCEIDPILHEEIVQRAVELAKIAWAASTPETTQLVTSAGQRSE